MKRTFRVNLALTILLLVCSRPGLYAQSSGAATIDFTREDVYQFHRFFLDGAGRKLFENVMSGRLTAYQDEDMKQVWTLKDLKAKLTYCYQIQIEADGIRDTVICDVPEASHAKLHFNYKNPKLSTSFEMGYHFYQADIQSVYFFVSAKEASALLTRDELLVIRRIDTWDGSRASHDDMLRPFTDSLMMKLAGPIYWAALAGRINAFTNDSLKTKMTQDQIAKRGGYQAVINVFTDPNDPYEMKDSSVWIDFQVEDITGLMIRDQWSTKGAQGGYQSIAIGPTFRLRQYPDILIEFPVFMTPWSDAMKQLTKEDKAYLQTMLHYLRMRKLDPERYRMEELN